MTEYQKEPRAHKATAEAPGAWAAAVGGAGLGAAGGMAAAAASKASRGIVGMAADKTHEALNKLNSPAKAKKMVGEQESRIRTYIETLEKHFGANGEKILANIEEATGRDIPREQVQSLFAGLKKSQFSDLPEESWKEVSDAAKKAAESLTKLGLKQGIVSRIPGGATTLTSVAGLIGAALAYTVVKGLHETAAQGQQGAQR